MFKHNICGDQPEILNGMPKSSNLLPLEFFVNPKLPLVPATSEATAAEVNPSKATKEPKKSASAGDQS